MKKFLIASLLTTLMVGGAMASESPSMSAEEFEYVLRQLIQTSNALFIAENIRKNSSYDACREALVDDVVSDQLEKAEEDYIPDLESAIADIKLDGFKQATTTMLKFLKERLADEQNQWKQWGAKYQAAQQNKS